jgi:hypothetical protein
MGFTAQLVQGVHLGVMGTEIAEELADGAAVVTRSAGAERNTEGIDCALEERSQGMRER